MTQLTQADPLSVVAAPGAASTDSWLLIGHLQSAYGPVDLQVHVAETAGRVRSTISVRDPETGRYLREELEHAHPVCVVLPDGVAVRWTGTWREIDVDLIVNCAERPILRDAAHEYGVPHAPAAGTVTIGRERYQVSGPSWYDHQWCTTPPDVGR